MSWFSLTVLILIVAFACAYGLCEWLARRWFGRGDDDRGPTAR
jgi:hypothetical protein